MNAAPAIRSISLNTTVTTTDGATQTVTLPDGTTTVEIAWVSGDVGLHRIQPKNTAARRIYSSSIGQPGQTLSAVQTAGSVFNTRDVITATAPKLVILDSWINEAGAAQAEATYKAAYQAFIDTAQAAGSDVLLFGGNPTSSGAALRPTYMGYLQDLATLNGIPFLDLAVTDARWASYSAANTAGWMDPDGVHLTALGAAAKAQAVFDRIAA